jgi:autotransporter translocation and assembly factor TamB
VDAAARASLRRNILSVTGITAQLKRSSIPDGNLQINLDTRAIRGEIPAIDAQLQDFVPDGAGPIQAAVRIDGTLDRPVGVFTALSPGLDIGGTHIDTVEAAAQLEGNVLQVTRLTAHQESGMLEAAGTFNIETKDVQATATVTNHKLTEVRGVSTRVNLNATVGGAYPSPSTNFPGELVDLMYRGQQHGTISVTGSADRQGLRAELQSAKYSASAEGTVSLAAPYAFEARVTTNQSQIQYGAYQFAAGGNIQAEGDLEPVALNRVEFESFTLKGEGIDLKAAGSLDTGVNVDATANLAQVPVAGVQLGGQAAVTGVVRGPWNDPQIDGVLRTTNATARSTEMPEAATIAA